MNLFNDLYLVEFHWFQTNPHQNYRLRINEMQFNNMQKHVRSKSKQNNLRTVSTLLNQKLIVF